MPVTDKERDALRSLAEKYMGYASLPAHREKMEMWKALNRRRMRRPMVLIDQIPWNELIPPKPPAAADPFWAGVGERLERTIHQWERFPADMVLEPYIVIPEAVHNSGYGLTPRVERLRLRDGETASSQKYANVIRNEEDIEKITDCRVTRDVEETQRRLDEAEWIFDGAAPVRPGRGIGFNLGLWDFIACCVPVEDLYTDMMDRPDFLHRVVSRLADAALAGIEQANAMQAHNDEANVCHCSCVYTDDLLPDFGAGRGSVSRNCWAAGLAQLFTSVSPAGFAEFELPYIARLAERFGAVYYGCCDRLDDRLDRVKKIPNVRKVSCSPWSDLENFARNIGPDLVMSVKPNPAFLAAFNEGAIRNEIARALRLARECNLTLEFILKDISTVQFEPSRLSRWDRIVREMVEASAD